MKFGFFNFFFWKQQNLKKTNNQKTSQVSAKEKKESGYVFAKIRQYIKHKHKTEVKCLERVESNPVLTPIDDNSWESWQTFNPAAFYAKGKVHLLYRALGNDGISRLGYATSKDGIHIDYRCEESIYTFYRNEEVLKTGPSYHSLPYISGGGWGGCEDPRVTLIGDTLYMLFVAFDGTPPRLAITSIKLEDFLNHRWDKWKDARIISRPGIIDKSGVVLPEKVNGKYVIMHRVFPNILVDFVDSLDFAEGEYLKEEFSINIREDNWDSRKIGAGAPPIKTKYGWLLVYYAVDDKDDDKYKMGAMLLDLNDPVKVLYRTDEPMLTPDEWYENKGHKRGVLYPCGAAVIDGELFVYYGGADTVVCVAHANLEEFLQELMTRRKIFFKRTAVVIQKKIQKLRDDIWKLIKK
jgi:predicted GH43/DUF377 family glycosyl hydrolase